MLLSHSICSSAARLGGARTHGEPPLAILLMIFMTPTSPAIRSKVDVSRILAQDFPKLGPDLTIHHQSACFLEDPFKALGGIYESQKAQGGVAPFAPDIRRGARRPPPPLRYPATSTFSGGCVPITDQIWGVFPQGCP